VIGQWLVLGTGLRQGFGESFGGSVIWYKPRTSTSAF